MFLLSIRSSVKNFHRQTMEQLTCTMLTSLSPAPPSTMTLTDVKPSLSFPNEVNENLSPDNNEDAPYDSESDLSEVAVPTVDEPSSATSANHQSEFGAQDTEASDTSDADAQGESDDADFDMEDSPAAVATNGGREERSTSTDSRRPAKRKAPVVDQHMLANPELFLLRRSVSAVSISTWEPILLTFC
jgi:chromodomain-helicase-DNA-binding protein 1